MRIKLTMHALSRAASLPLDNHSFAALIYNLLGAADYGTALFLHDEGVQALPNDKKRFKPFVFSRLQQVGKRVHAGRQWLAEGPVEWQIGSPIEELILLMMDELSANPIIFIGDQQGGAQFEVTAIRQIAPPRFTSPMRFKTLSPIFAAVTERTSDGKSIKHHLRAEDPSFATSIERNLRAKFCALTGDEALADKLSFVFVGTPKSQLVQYAGTDHKCYEGVFEVAGSTRLMHLG
jgi:CRISPR-associated endoribonuclease Cas6